MALRGRGGQPRGHPPRLGGVPDTLETCNVIRVIIVLVIILVIILVEIINFVGKGGFWGLR